MNAHTDSHLRVNLDTVAHWSQGSAIRFTDWHRLQTPPLDYYPAMDLVDAGLVSTVMMPHKVTGRPQRYVELDSSLVDRLGIVCAARVAGWVRPSQT